MESKIKRLQGKRIALCVTSSIAAIEAPKIARELRRHGAAVQAYMSEASKGIIHPTSMEFATEREVITKFTGKVEHLYDFDLVLVAPATANTISKIACGIADSPLLTLILSSKANVLIAPAMHGSMYENSILRENIEKLKKHNYKFIGPKFEEGKAKLAEIKDMVDAVIFELYKKDMKGAKVVVTAGPTIEYIDPVRIITNKSSGKMGIAIAREAYFRGAEVKLIYGFGTEKVPAYLSVVNVETGEEMLKAVKKEMPYDVFISAAAVSDFTVEKSKKKIDSRKGRLQLQLIPTLKILNEIKNKKTFKVGFKALHGVSKNELLTAANKAMKDYGLDLVIANDVSKGACRSDENEAYILDGKKVEHIPKTTKDEIAVRILEKVRK